MFVANKDSKFVFVGNRYYVLNKLLNHNCNICEIYCVRNSYLESELKKRDIRYKLIENKQNLIDELKMVNYDILVSNGCPYILPISKLKKKQQLFINVHPSLLPDLKGKHPINGAVLLNRPHGVTCHFMDDGIDTGEIIEQIRIPVDKINLDLLYKISFAMEGEVFERAMLKGFNPTETVYHINNPVYYTRNDNDYIIFENDDFDIIDRKIRAFNTNGQYARIIHEQYVTRVTECSILENEWFDLIYKECSLNSVIDIYGDGYFLYKAKQKYIQFKTIDKDSIHIGDCLKLGV